MNAKQRRKRLRQKWRRDLWRFAHEGEVCAWCHRRIVAPCAHAYKATRTPGGGLEVHCLVDGDPIQATPAAAGVIRL